MAFGGAEQAVAAPSGLSLPWPWVETPADIGILPFGLEGTTSNGAHTLLIQAAPQGASDEAAEETPEKEDLDLVLAQIIDGAERLSRFPLTAQADGPPGVANNDRPNARCLLSLLLSGARMVLISGVVHLCARGAAAEGEEGADEGELETAREYLRGHLTPTAVHATNAAPAQPTQAGGNAAAAAASLPADGAEMIGLDFVGIVVGFVSCLGPWSGALHLASFHHLYRPLARLAHLHAAEHAALAEHAEEEAMEHAMQMAGGGGGGALPAPPHPPPPAPPQPPQPQAPPPPQPPQPQAPPPPQPHPPPGFPGGAAWQQAAAARREAMGDPEAVATVICLAVILTAAESDVRLRPGLRETLQMMTSRGSNYALRTVQVLARPCGSARHLRRAIRSLHELHLPVPVISLLDTVSTCSSWHEVRESAQLIDAFERLPELLAATNGTDRDATLQTRCLHSLFVDYSLCARMLHKKLDMAVRAGATLAVGFATRSAAWLRRIEREKSLKDTTGYATTLIGADVLCVMLEAHKGQLNEAEVEKMTTVRGNAINWLAKHVHLSMTDMSPSEIESWLPKHDLSDHPPLHPATCAALNARRLKSGAFDTLFEMSSKIPLSVLDSSLRSDAAALKGREGLTVRYPESRLDDHALGGKWICSLEKPTQMEMDTDGGGSSSGSSSNNNDAAHNANGNDGVRVRLHALAVKCTRPQHVEGDRFFDNDRFQLPGAMRMNSVEDDSGPVKCSLTITPEPTHFEMLFTSSCLHGHAPRVRFLPPTIPDNPLVHTSTGLLSPLALEHMPNWVANGSAGLPTAANVVDFVEMLLLCTPSRQLPHGLVETCAVNEKACWRYVRGEALRPLSASALMIEEEMVDAAEPMEEEVQPPHPRERRRGTV